MLTDGGKYRDWYLVCEWIDAVNKGGVWGTFCLV